MRSSNPVFSRRGFSRGEGYAGFGGAQPQTQGSPYAGGNPYAGTNPYDTTTYQAPPTAPAQTGRMTMDDVVTKTAITLGTVVVGACWRGSSCRSARPATPSRAAPAWWPSSSM